MAKFNGHKNWNHWNVSLWLNNDEGFYRKMLRELAVCGYTHTPDGAPYSVSSIQSAMRGF